MSHAHVNIIPKDGSHTIQYGREHYRHRSHLIAHECGHLQRFYLAQPKDRLVPVVGPEQRKIADRDTIGVFEFAEPWGVTREAYAKIQRNWHNGTMMQLANYPADMRIERWLKENYPALADVQLDSIRFIVEDSRKIGRDRTLTVLTPQKVYRAVIAMNAAYNKYMSYLFQDPQLIAGYDTLRHWEEGGKLADEIWYTPDTGHAGDVEETKKWAELFMLEKWFEWKAV